MRLVKTNLLGVVKLKGKKKIALVLSGGGLKAAAFHVGVCLALREKGFKLIGGTQSAVEDNPDAQDPLAIKTYVGSSAGALLSAYIASGHKLEDIIESFEFRIGDFFGRAKRKPKIKPLNYLDLFTVKVPTPKSLWKYLSGRSITAGGIEAVLKNNLKFNGFFTLSNLERYIRQNILVTNSFMELGVELFAVATHLDESKKTVFGPISTSTRDPEANYASHATISDAVCASASLPPFFGPYPIKDLGGKTTYYFDGEIRDTLSSHIGSDNGADLVITSYSIQPYRYNEQIGTLAGYGLPVILNQALYQVIEQKIARRIQYRENTRAFINSVSGYFKEHGLPEEHREKLVDILTKKAHENPNVDYINIHPKPEDHVMFFADHFSMNPSVLEQIVRVGFRSAIATLRKHNL